MRVPALGQRSANKPHRLPDGTIISNGGSELPSLATLKQGGAGLGIMWQRADRGDATAAPGSGKEGFAAEILPIQRQAERRLCERAGQIFFC